MYTLNNNDINILDLPDEILLRILNKLHTIEMLYSLVNVNQRFDRLVLDRFYIHHLDLTIKPLLYHNSSVNNQKIFDGICTQVLPRIHHKINKFTIEPLSMKYILDTIDYSQLNSLSLVNFQSETLLQHLTGDTILLRLLNNQITHLTIDITDKISEIPDGNQLNMFALILSISKCLIDLTFTQRTKISFSNLPSTTCVSSTLTKSNITVNTFDDCLYLLDGCLQHLSILIIHIIEISDSSLNIDNTKNLPKLKCLSLTSYWYTYFYNNRIVPLLRRIGFQGGMFNKVRWLVMLDIRPFENEFFQVISHSFPLLQRLSITNLQSQKNKQNSSTFITFAHLFELDLKRTHIDYVVQFLFDKNTSLPRLTHLTIRYEPLATVTQGFTNDAAHLTCAKIKRLVIQEPFVRPEKFLSYFSSLYRLLSSNLVNIGSSYSRSLSIHRSTTHLKHDGTISSKPRHDFKDSLYFGRKVKMSKEKRRKKNVERYRLLSSNLVNIGSSYSRSLSIHRSTTHLKHDGTISSKPRHDFKDSPYFGRKAQMPKHKNVES
ncbi:unnamed protein product [Rotaria sordida]|uniref:F-box domain-containing protein n=1 Tax=Rotaria sordida TaxID=392033 RepID=A0A815JKL0_9BILA|nr:unnamed protein product [Rotaria sordida]